MNNDSEEITASEINKFTYCPYQFYYDRLYGQKYIRALKKELLKSKGLTDTSKSNFVSGLEFHKNFDDTNYKSYPIFKLLILVILAVIGYAFYDEISSYILRLFNYFSYM